MMSGIVSATRQLEAEKRISEANPANLVSSKIIIMNPIVEMLHFRTDEF